MSYKRKLNRHIFSRFFDDADYQNVNRVCKRYEGLMKDAGMTKMNVQYSSIQRLDAMCEVPSGVAGCVKDEIETELEHSMPGAVEVGEARITDIGNGMSRVQVPILPR